MWKRYRVWIIAGIGLLAVTVTFWMIAISQAKSWIKENVEVVTVVTTQCPVGESVIEYKFAAFQDNDIICNTEDKQEALATLEDGTTYSFFLEYDGAFASWSAPEGFTCDSASWTDYQPVEREGVTEIEGRPEQVLMTCNDTSGHALFMGAVLNP